MLAMMLAFVPAQGQAAEERAALFTPGQNLADMAFTTTGGAPYTLRDLPEPVVLLHYWASWCPPCVIEFPKLLEALREMNGQVALVAISLDYKADAMQRYIDTLDTHGVPIYWVQDSNYDLSLRQHRILGTPETVFLDQQRSVVKKVNDEHDWQTRKSWKELTAMVAGSM